MKRLLAVSLILILSFQIVSAVEFIMNENYQQGETIIAKVSGNFLTSVTKDNVLFYRGHVRIPMEYSVAEIEEEYYIYALTTGKDPGNYSVSIENTQYMKGPEIAGEKIVKNFSIISEMADLSVKPGFVVTSDDFFLQIQNLQENRITVDINVESNDLKTRKIFISLPETAQSKNASVSLKSGEIKDIPFTLGEGESGLQKIELKTENLTYEIPVYIFISLEGKKGKNFYFEPSELIFSFQANTKTKKTVHLYNTGDSEIKNISLSLSDSLKPFVNLSVDKIESLKNNSDVPVELSFFSSTETEAEGYLKAKTDNLSASSFIIFDSNANYTSANETETPSSTKNCAELNGTLFNTQTEKCDKEYENVKDGWCCFGTVSKIENNNSTGQIIAIILSILVIGILVWFYLKKYKKARKPINLLKIAKGKK